MTPEDQLLCTCSRQNFLDHHRNRVLAIAERTALDWPAVYSTALSHGVAPLVFSNLRRCVGSGLAVPQPTMAQFQHCFFRNMLVKERWAETLTEAIAFFHQKSIEVMLIKGIALDHLVYEHPTYTMSQDIDIVLKARRESLSSEDHRQIGDRLHRLGIEYDFFEHHDVTMNNVLPVDFAEIWDRATKADYRGQTVWLMAPEDMLLVTCINSCRKRFFRLKSLCDIAEIIAKYPHLNWASFTHRARQYQCHNIVYTSLVTTQMTLGYDELPATTLNDLRVNSFRAALIRFLVRHILRHLSLARTFPFSGPALFGRQAHLSLLLPYATYRWDQLWRKLREVNRAWQLQP